MEPGYPQAAPFQVMPIYDCSGRGASPYALPPVRESAFATLCSTRPDGTADVMEGAAPWRTTLTAVVIPFRFIAVADSSLTSCGFGLFALHAISDTKGTNISRQTTYFFASFAAFC